MPKRAISTDKQLGALKPEARPYFATVDGCPGLRVKVAESAKGTLRTFLYRYRAPDGRLEQKSIGHYDPPHFGLKDARERWRAFKDIRETHGHVREYVEQERAKNVAELKAAAQATERDGYTVAKLARDFVDHQSGRIATWKKTDANLRNYVLPHIGDLPAHAVRRRDVLAILDGLVRTDLTVTANRVLAAIRAMFNWAIQHEKHGLEMNPCVGIKPSKEVPRERVLGDVELRRLLLALPDSPLTLDERDLLEFLLLTACRLSEAAAAPLAEFHERDALWVLPGKRAKNDREHRLPLSRQAAALVKRRTGESPWLFQMAGDPDRPMRGDHIHTPLREALPALKVLPFTPHDLRRTAASGLATLGAPRDIVRRVLNHVDPTVTARYDRADYTPEMRRWLQAWADHLDRLRGAAKAKGKRASAR